MTYNVRLNYGDIRKLERNLGVWLLDTVQEAVEETRPHVHVDTGRLQKSLRAAKLIKQNKVWYTAIVAGGIRLKGVVRETDIERDVAYALYEELRHPQIRTYAIPAIIRRTNA